MDCGSDDGVIERGTTLRGSLLQSLLEQVDIRREVLVEIGILAEIDHESFIFGIAGSNQIEHRLIHLVSFFTHGAGVVDYDAHRHRNIVPVKGGSRLRHSVLECRERRSVETSDEASLLIYDRSVQDHFPHFRLEHEDSALIVRGLLTVRFRWHRCAIARRRRRSIGYWERLLDAGCAWRSWTRRGGLTLYSNGCQSEQEAHAAKHHADAPPLERSCGHGELLSAAVIVRIKAGLKAHRC